MLEHHTLQSFGMYRNLIRLKVLAYMLVEARSSRVRFPTVSLEFYRHNLPGRTTTLGSTRPLTGMCATNISLGGGGGKNGRGGR